MATPLIRFVLEVAIEVPGELDTDGRNLTNDIARALHDDLAQLAAQHGEVKYVVVLGAARDA